MMFEVYLFCYSERNLCSNLCYVLFILNLKFTDEIKQDHIENEQHELIFIGTCGLHTIHGAFKTGAESTHWNIKKTLKGASQVLHDSPARCKDYLSVTGSDVFPLNFWSRHYTFFSGYLA